jgi:propanol-preferring alcohol dehydrogenase
MRQGAAACFKSFSDAAHARFDVIVDFTGVGTTAAEIVKALSAGGCIVLVGMGVPTMELSTLTIVTRRIQIHESLDASLAEFGEVFELISKG